MFCIEAILHAAALFDPDIRTCHVWASSPSHAATIADIIRKARNNYSQEEHKQVEEILTFLDLIPDMEEKAATGIWLTAEKAFEIQDKLV